jgi:hypothetical protein
VTQDLLRMDSWVRFKNNDKKIRIKADMKIKEN